MVWEKKGLIIAADGQREWMSSHIQNPFAVEFDSFVRVYFTTRPKPVDGQYKSVTAFMDLDRSEERRVGKECYS